MSATTENRGIDRHGLICGSVLIALFLAPDIIGDPLVFPIHALRHESGLGLTARLVSPLFGAILFTLALVTLADRTRAFIAFLTGCAGTLLLTVPEINHLPVGPAPATIVAVVMGGGAWILRRRRRGKWAIRAAIALPTVVCLVWNVGMVIGHDVSISYLVIFKTPIQIFLLMEAAFVTSDAGEP